MIKELPIQIDVALFRCHVVVIFGWTLDEIIEWGLEAQIEAEEFTPAWRSWIEEAISSAAGFCAGYGAKNPDVLIWLKNRPHTSFEHGPLWHELSHAVDNIANRCDPDYHFFNSVHGSEPRAYLYEFLAVRITKDLWNREEAPSEESLLRPFSESGLPTLSV